MSHSVHRLASVLAGIVLAALLVLMIGAAPASARPNCDVPVPPPVCGDVEPVEKLPDLTAAVSGPGAATGGTGAGYTVTLANPSASLGTTARNVAVRIAVTGGATVSTPAASGWTCQGSGASATCAGGSLANGASATIPVTVVLPSGAATVGVSATADPGGIIAERNEGNNTATAFTAVTAPSLPDLQVSMTGPTSVRGLYAAGVWTMTVTNAGSAPASIVNVEWLTNWGGSVNANAVKSGAIGFTCVVPPEYLQQIVRCYGTGVLQPGASATITITAVPPAPGNVYGTSGVSNVTATVDYAQQVAESNEANNASTVVSTILP